MMKMITTKKKNVSPLTKSYSNLPFWRISLLLSILVIFVSLLGMPVAEAVDSPGMTVNGPCMDNLFPGNLGCTANDVRIASADASTLVITDPCSFPGDSVTFTARFNLALSATERYDIGMFFANDGDPNNDGALTGSCSISTLAEAPSPFTDLDGASSADLCGDIRRSGTSQFPSKSQPITITAQCIDDNGDGFLDLPNCTSWRQSGANDVCTSPLQAFPGSPSKCNCDANFQVPVPVPPPSMKVVKKATPNVLPEPGGNFTYTVTVTNSDGSGDPLNTITLNSLIDDKFGNLFSATNELGGNTCNDAAMDKVLSAGESVSCQFTANVSGNANGSHTNIVTASGKNGRNVPVSNYDNETVTFTDKKPTISVNKVANPTSVPEPGGQVTFTFTVSNTSVEPVTITSLTDSVFGNLSGDVDCQVGTELAVGASCSFTSLENVSGNAGGSHTNTFTAEAKDDEGNTASANDPAEVTLTDVASSIEVLKTATPDNVNEPGGNVNFKVDIKNTSTTDTVTITTLTDDVYGSLDGKGVCDVTPGVVLAPGASYSCSFTGEVTGNAGDSHVDVVTATGTDDDGKTVTDDDNATVVINDVPPTATLTKTVTSTLVTYKVVVTNTSSAEPLALNALSDDKFGNITQLQGKVQSTTCAVPQNIAKNGGKYTCTFNAIVDQSPHTNTVTGTVNDDDGGSVVPAPKDDATVTYQ